MGKEPAMARLIINGITLQGRFQFVCQHFAAHPEQAEEHAGFIKWLGRLVTEEEMQIYNDPATDYGAILHLQSIPEDDALAELVSLGLKDIDEEAFTLPELKAFLSQVAAFKMPVLSESELARMYDLASTPRGLARAVDEQLDSTSACILNQYGTVKGFYEYCPSLDQIETTLSSFSQHPVDIQAAICQTVLKQLEA